MKSQRGQVILILLLVMSVALAVGLSIVQRSLTDISISTKVEDSSRAFSAAEAGIEKALIGTAPETFSVDFSAQNNSSARVVDSGLVPADNQALEYPPISKEEIAHVWLADPQANFKSSTGQYYNQNTLEVYWGTSAPSDTSDRPALEVTVVYLSSGAYKSKKFFLDPVATRASDNGFQNVSANCSLNLAPINTVLSSGSSLDRKFYCKATLDFTDLPGSTALVLLRGRVLYSNSSHPFAVVPKGSCSGSQVACSLPRQAQIIQSIGSAGNTQRTVQLFKLIKVVPFYFDYAIFSAGEIDK